MQATLPDCDARLPATASLLLAGNLSETRPFAAPLGRIGALEVRLARNASEIAAAQEVRYRVFYGELGASPVDPDGASGRDSDRFDAVCDHLLVLDESLPGPDHRRIVGTYRLLRQERAAEVGGFYSEDEFELTKLVARHPGERFLEAWPLMRASGVPVQAHHRGAVAGRLDYINDHRIDVMTGCASFHGVDTEAHAEALSYLARNCRARAGVGRARGRRPLSQHGPNVARRRST